MIKPALSILVVIAFLTTACQQTDQTATAEPEQSETVAPTPSNKEYVKQNLNAIKAQDVAGINAVVNENWVGHSVNGDNNRKQMIEANRNYFILATAWDYEITHQVEEGDLVTTRLIWSAIQDTELNDMPASGKVLKLSVIRIDRIADGSIVESWYEFDPQSIGKQLQPEETTDTAENEETP